MTRDDADFAAYLAARWPELVRTVALLGCPDEGAPAVARSALAGCYREWERVRSGVDVDAHVHGELLAAWHHHTRRRRDEPAPEPAPPPAEDADEAVRLRHALEEALRELTPSHREVLVLRFAAGLDEAQLADVLDVAVPEVRRRLTQAGVELRLDPAYGAPAVAFPRAAESIEVGPPSLDAVVAEAHDRSRRYRLVVAAGSAAVLVAVAGLAWGGVRTAREDLPQPDVVRTINPVGVAWYADGRLHLARVIVDVPGVTDLTEVDGGVVYGDRDGVVAFVSEDGERRLLGRRVADTPVVASEYEGWAAWVEIDPEGRRVLRVYDIGEDRVVGDHVPESDGAVPVAIDQHRLYYDADGTAYSWTPTERAGREAAQAELLDVQSGSRVFAVDDDEIQIAQPFFNVAFRRPGSGALLSPGGVFLISRTPGAAAGRPFEPILYDTRTGQPQPPHLAATERALDATFDGSQAVLYLVARDADALDPDSLLVLRSCSLGEGGCTDRAPVRVGDGPAMFAR